MTVTVRRATAKDARAVAEFAIKLFAQHRNYDAHRFADISSVEGAERFYGSQTEATDAAVLVAEFENKVVGLRSDGLCQFARNGGVAARHLY
jgi:hypothetical protein